MWSRSVKGTKRNGNFGLQVFVPNSLFTPYASTLHVGSIDFLFKNFVGSIDFLFKNFFYEPADYVFGILHLCYLKVLWH